MNTYKEEQTEEEIEFPSRERDFRAGKPDLSRHDALKDKLRMAGFTVSVKNNGYHWIITKEIRVDCWPTKSKFILNGKGKAQVGISDMLKRIGVPT